MKKFNIALIPSDAAVQVLFAELAQSYFSGSQDGYILGNDALAHVTLCQFYAKNDQAARDSFHTYNDNRSIELLITKFRLRSGDETHTGKVWAEFLIERVADLLERQQKCFQHLIQKGLEPLTPVETYSPHITLARLTNEPSRIPSVDAGPRHPITFRPVVGASTENGVLIRTL